MPQITQLDQIQHVDLENLSFEQLTDSLRDHTALSLVRETIDRYESGERTALYNRWIEADRLYSGYKERLLWEGSTVDRANYPVRIVFDQVEAALPAIREALFGSNDWFDCVPLPGGDPKAAQDVKARLKYVFGQQRGGYGPTAISEIMESVKSMLVYGQGILGIEFNPESKLPEVVSIDPRDMFMDMGNTTPWVDNCRSVIRRSMKTVEDLEKWRGTPNIKLPDNDTLWTLTKNAAYMAADSSKDSKRSLIGEYGTVAGDTIPMPKHGLVEVLTYYSNSRIITVLGRNYCIFNQKNPYGCLPFVVMPCYTYPYRFMAQGYSDVLFEIQRVTEALMNGRMDEISLALNPPRTNDDRSLMTPSQESWRPGAVYGVKDVKNSMQVVTSTAVATNIWNELEFYKTAGELRTGLNGLAQGSARPGNVNRTAGGVSTQMQASALRLSTLVWNAETFGIAPLVAKLHKFLTTHEQPGDFAAANTQEGYGYVPTSSYFKPVTFTVKASSTMLSQERLKDVLPMIMQNLTNGQMVQGLSAAKMTIDWPEFFRLLQDAAGTKEVYALVRPMNEQETQAMNQPPPQVQAMMQKSQQDTQRALQLKQMDNQTDLQLKQMDKQPNPMEMQQEAQKAQLDMAVKQMELQFKEKELAMKEREGQMKIEMKRMEMQTKAQQAQLDVALGQHKAQNDMAIGQQKLALSQHQTGLEAQRSEAEHEFGMRSMSEQGALQSKLNKDKMTMSAQRLASTKEKAQGRKARPSKE